MPRTVKPGISFYRMDSGHIRNTKIRLLFNEFDSDGYYIWHALLDFAYGKWGYYFDMNDGDELELFASEYCKKKVDLVKEVIAGCLRRGLFDEHVAELFGILTSDMMQETFIIATADRRDKGTTFQMQGEWLDEAILEQIPKNIDVVRGNIINVRQKNELVPPKNTQRREEKIREEERRKENTGPGGLPPAAPPDLRKIFESIERKKKPLYIFIRDNRPGFIEPYVELWNIFAGERKKPVVSKITDSRKKKFATRIAEKAFDFPKILEKAGGAGDFLSVSNWFTFDWILENDSNYLKVIEGNYDPDKQKSPAGAAGSVAAKDLDYLYNRFLEGAQLNTLLQEKHCDYLVDTGQIEVRAEHIETAVLYRIKNLTGTNNAGELRAIQAYQAGNWASDTDCAADAPHRYRIAKKLAAIELFNRC